jgi:hypothetical protein
MNTVPKTLIQHFRFRMVTSLSFMLVVFVLAAVPVPAQEPGVQGMPVAGMGTTRPMGRLLFRETFDTLDRWRHESFPKIESSIQVRNRAEGRPAGSACPGRGFGILPAV